MKTLIMLGGVNAALAVMLGAFGAHGLKARLTPQLMETYQTAVQYHFYHALGLILVGLVAAFWPDRSLIRPSGYLLFSGIILFSGSLYILSLTGIRWLGAITPLGGLAFILGWLLFCVAVFKA